MNEYNVKFFTQLKNAHVFKEFDKRPLCEAHINHPLEKETDMLSVEDMRTELAILQNTGINICGGCAGRLYSDKIE